MENIFDSSWGIKAHELESNIRGLRDKGIDMPDCCSVSDYRYALETLLSRYSNEPGKLRWIYAELRRGVNGAYGTSYQQKLCMADVANRLVMNYPTLKMIKEERYDLYKRLFTITVISGKIHDCSKCSILDNKKYDLMEDFVIGYDPDKVGKQDIKISLPIELSEAMESCISDIGCKLILS